ncbi:hypothetical protein [uncultured Vibrio sp.]|uniref:hypothetical protein n=1 Tax=uncultured Vibrio sp. TaxID=114054 RepID=UPI00262FF9BE|nr:hypothetical protein [uncultured Vibrio sp.]
MEPSKYKYPITAKLIRDARLRSGLQQKDFISQNNLEITQATFSRWETGQAQVPVSVLLKLGLIAEGIAEMALILTIFAKCLQNRLELEIEAQRKAVQ